MQTDSDSKSNSDPIGSKVSTFPALKNPTLANKCDALRVNLGAVKINIKQPEITQELTQASINLANAYADEYLKNYSAVTYDPETKEWVIEHHGKSLRPPYAFLPTQIKMLYGELAPVDYILAAAMWHAS
jgi:hypothetical protein